MFCNIFELRCVLGSAFRIYRQRFLMVVFIYIEIFWGPEVMVSCTAMWGSELFHHSVVYLLSDLIHVCELSGPNLLIELILSCFNFGIFFGYIE